MKMKFKLIFILIIVVFSPIRISYASTNFELYEQEDLKTYYITSNVNVREGKGGEVIYTKRKGEKIEAYNEDGYLIFEEEGEQRSIWYTFATTEAPEHETEVYYIRTKANVRSGIGGPVIGTKEKGEEIKAYREGNYLVFEEDGEVKSIWYTLASTDKPEKEIKTYYIISNVNVREGKGGEVIYTKRKGEKIEAYNEDGYLIFEEEGEQRSIWYTFATTEAPEHETEVYYIRTKANVRSGIGGPVIGTKEKGEEIKAYREGNYLVFEEDGEVKSIWYTLATTKSLDRLSPYYLTDTQIKQVIDVAIKQLNIPYLVNGTDPIEGFDCSGLIWHVYQEALGFKLPRDPKELAEYGYEIDKSELLPGDIILFDSLGKDEISHAQLYLGEIDGFVAPQVIHSTTTIGGQKIGKVCLEDYDTYENKPLIKYIRVYGINAAKQYDFKVNREVPAFTTNVKASDTDRIELFTPGDLINNGTLHGQYIRFIYTGPKKEFFGKVAFIPKTGVDIVREYNEMKLMPQDDANKDISYFKDFKDYFLKQNTYVREGKGGEVIYTKRKGEKIEAYKEDGYLIFEEEGKQRSIWYTFATTEAPEHETQTYYITTKANVRSGIGGSVIGTKEKGEEIKAYREGNYLVFEEDGKVKSIWYTLATTIKI